jgi:predicted RNA-binding protein YlqC (UPF0109 family)
MADKGQIVERVVRYIVREIVDNPEQVKVEIVEDGADTVTAEVSTAKSDMGRVIGKRGRVANAIRTIAEVAAEEEGLKANVEFLD